MSRFFATVFLEIIVHYIKQLRGRFRSTYGSN